MDSKRDFCLGEALSPVFESWLRYTDTHIYHTICYIRRSSEISAKMTKQ